VSHLLRDLLLLDLLLLKGLHLLWCHLRVSWLTTVVHLVIGSLLLL